MNNDCLVELMGSCQMLEQHRTLEEGLGELARLSACLLKVERCSIMLLTTDDGGQDSGLRVYSYHGRLPSEALHDPMPLSAGIAGHVLQSGSALFLDDVGKSELADLARGGDYSCPSLICAIIRDAGGRIGVINISEPCRGRRLTEDDLHLVEVFARMIGQSIHTFQLQKLVDSRVLQMAVLQEQREHSSAFGQPISPDPARLAKVVARNFYRDLTNAGFGPNAVIAVASEVLSTLHSTLAKHKERRERETVGPRSGLDS